MSKELFTNQHRTQAKLNGKTVFVYFFNDENDGALYSEKRFSRMARINKIALYKMRRIERGRP